MDPRQEQQTTTRRQDAELVQAVLSGETSAYGEFYDRYFRLVGAVCFDCTGNATEAQDLCHEAFLMAFRGLGRLRRPDRVGAWLIVTAKRLCHAWRRGHGREKVHLGRYALSLCSPGGEADDHAWDDDEIHMLHQAILALPAQERLAIQLFYLLDEPADRARSVLGLSSSGLYKLLDRARGRLGRSLLGARRHLDGQMEG